MLHVDNRKGVKVMKRRQRHMCQSKLRRKTTIKTAKYAKVIYGSM